MVKKNTKENSLFRSRPEILYTLLTLSGLILLSTVICVVLYIRYAYKSYSEYCKYQKYVNSQTEHPLSNEINTNGNTNNKDFSKEESSLNCKLVGYRKSGICSTIPSGKNNIVLT